MSSGFWTRNKPKPGAPPIPKLKYDGVEVMLDPSIYREGMKSKTAPVNFIFANGGVGDYVNWMASMMYVADFHKHVDGIIHVTEIFAEVAEWLMRPYPRWKIQDRRHFKKNYIENSLVAFAKPGEQLLNATGQHLLTLGFNYFCAQAEPPPKYNFLPAIDYEGPWKWPELNPKEPYAIFTPGATSPIREMPVEGFNTLALYTKNLGVRPVFLGKREVSQNYTANFAGYDYSLGLDLRERTTLLEATQLMRGAEFVIGLDNGLLHLAGCTDVPVIFGHNIAALEHRQIRRRHGLTVDITVEHERLACIGCQSKMRFLYNHHFKKCLFGDAKCIDILFENRAERWRKAIDEALDSGKGFRA